MHSLYAMITEACKPILNSAPSRRTALSSGDMKP